MPTTRLAQAVRNAVEAELSAERFYRQLAENTRDEEAFRFLTQLADQEIKHADAFKKFGEQLEAGELPFAADFNVEVIEAAPEWAYTEDMSYRQALTIALENEQRAELYYDALAETTEGKISEFFAKIAKVEQQHVHELEERISR